MQDTKCRNDEVMPLRVPFTASALNDLSCAAPTSPFIRVSRTYPQ